MKPPSDEEGERKPNVGLDRALLLAEGWADLSRELLMAFVHSGNQTVTPIPASNQIASQPT